MHQGACAGNTNRSSTVYTEPSAPGVLSNSTKSLTGMVPNEVFLWPSSSDATEPVGGRNRLIVM